MRNFIIIFSGINLFLLTSCFRPLETREAILEEETLIKVLADIHLAEARLSDYNSMKMERRDSFAAAYYSSIFQIYQVDTADFQQSMEAYAANPEKMNLLYEKVLTRLQQNESKYVEGSKKPEDKNRKKKNTNPLKKKIPLKNNKTD